MRGITKKYTRDFDIVQKIDNIRFTSFVFLSVFESTSSQNNFGKTTIILSTSTYSELELIYKGEKGARVGTFFNNLVMRMGGGGLDFHENNIIQG